MAGFSCWSVMPSASVSRSLAEQIRRGAGARVDFAEVAPFAWDRVFIFGPYTSPSAIEACLGFPWQGASGSGINSNKSCSLVVFVRDGAVVCWFDHPRRDGDLVELADPKGYSRQEATFRVRRDPNDQRFVLSR
jgi:hypothetical protein